MVDSADPTGHTLEPARSASLAVARRRTILAAVARPAAEVAGLLLVEILRSPRARAAALSLAQSLTCWLPGRHRPVSGPRRGDRFGGSHWVKDSDSGVLVQRVETALVVVTGNAQGAAPRGGAGGCVAVPPLTDVDRKWAERERT